MSDQSDDTVTDAAGGAAAAPGRPAGRRILGVRAGQGRLGGFFRPVDYARSRARYRPPPDLYRWLNHRLGPAATSLGLGPPDVITLEVPGRRSGVIRRTTMVRAVCNGEHYVVALAGESQWVRNVRAAGGQVVVGRRQRRAARLVEVPPQQRAPVIRAYLLRWGRRAGSRAVASEARNYFGVGADALLAEISGVAEHYPVFRIEYAGEAGARPEEIATGVYRLETGRGLTEANVYLVQSGPAWVLIDTAWPHRGQLIKSAAESLFGTGARPAAIVLTHIHPDHSGSALELAKLWDLPVHVHPRELPLAPGGYLPQYGNPLDRWLIAPVLRLMPSRKVEASLARNSLEGTAVAFDPAAGVPGLPDWQAVPTPGHTPGHAAFFRSSDRVLITGDAVLTINLNSVPDLLAGRHRVSGPPYISTWDWPAAKQSVAALARLRPEVLACGHGCPMTGTQVAASLASFSDRFSQQPSPSRYRKGRTAKTGRAPPPGGPARQTRRVSWTATDQEQTMPLPGDDLVPSPMVQATHALTISAPPQQVWPWLVQTGQGRAGFYSDSPFWDRSVDWYYRHLSHQQPGKATVGYHVVTDERIVPAWQNPRVGDIVADGPPGTAYYVVRQAEPGKSWVLFTDTHLRYLLPARLRDNPRLGIFGELSDSCLLTEPEPGTTRLIRRMRLSCGPWPFRAYVVPVVLIWGEAITARNFLRGVKRRAEVVLVT
jgi:glyoxylase-like metal-dependent hydrolase (beta-lactamase superfamily II)